VAEPYTILARAGAETPTAVILSELARALGEFGDAREVGIWRCDGTRLVRDVSWPGRTGPEEPTADRAADLSEAVTAEGARIGLVTLVAGPRTEVGDDLRDRLRRTADCVRLLHRRDRLRHRLHEQVRHTHRLSGELADAGRRMDSVRELERRRMATEILGIGTGRLARLQRRVDELDADLAAGARPDGSVTTHLHDLLSSLTDDFRVMVRGIHPQVLHSRGPQAALADVVAGYGGRVRLGGTVPARIDRELAAALYRVTAAALQAMAGDPPDEGGADGDPVVVELVHGGGQLAVTVTGGAPIAPATLRAALTLDLDRVAALGGRVDVGPVRDRPGIAVQVRATLPDRLEPDPVPDGDLDAGVFSRVRALTLGIASRYPDGPGAGPAQFLVGRLDAPTRLGVHEGCWFLDPGAFVLLDRRLPDLELVPCWADQPPDAYRPDVVLRPAAGPEQRDGAHRFDVALAGGGVLIGSVSWAELPARLITEVVARADLLRARTLLNGLTALLRSVPLAGPAARWFAYDLEELRAATHELDELEALAWVRAGIDGLPADQIAFAERLLSSSGAPAPERLGLPPTAGPSQVQRTARRQIDLWRRAVGTGASARHQRQAFRVIAQSCEALLAESLLAERLLTERRHAETGLAETGPAAGAAPEGRA
jgi:hypothetical protein